MQKISTIAVITDDQFFRDASTYFLSQRYTVLDIGQNEQEIYVQLPQQRPDFVILHTGYSSRQGACLMRCIAEYRLPTKILAYCDEASQQSALLHASLARTDGLDAMLRSVALLEGSPVQPAQSMPDPLAVLSPQELKVFAMIGQGLGSSQMAGQLFVSMHTIKNHKTNIKRKLAVANSREILAIALVMRNHSGQTKTIITNKINK